MEDPESSGADPVSSRTSLSIALLNMEGQLGAAGGELCLSSRGEPIWVSGPSEEEGFAEAGGQQGLASTSFLFDQIRDRSMTPA